MSLPVSKNFTSSALVGKPPFQLAALDQLVSVPLAPVHEIVAARVVDATDIAVSNVRSMREGCFM